MANKSPVKITFDGLGSPSGLAEFTSTDTISIANGGTSATTATDALTNLLPSQSGNSGKVLTTNGSTTSWTTASGGGGTFNDLTDVVITTPTTGQLVKYDGTNWINYTDTFASEGTNSDITSMTGITAGISSPDFIQFDTTATVTDAVGKLSYNNGDGTLNVTLKGGNLNLLVGQQEVQLIYNGTGSTLNKGQLVYVTGAQGQRITVALANASTEATSSKTIGIIAESIANTAEGFMITSGIIRGLNTSAYTQGDGLWLSTTAGTFTTTRPSAPNHGVFIGWIVNSHASSGSIFVKVQNGYELDELHNVLLTSSTNNDVLMYDSANTYWKNVGYNTALNAMLPSQSGKSGMFLTTNGTTTSWATAGGGGGTTLAALTDVSLASLVNNDFLIYNSGTSKWINATPATIKTNLTLNNVENTALSTWAGTSNITTLGTIGTGTWNATAIADGKIASALTGKTYNGLTLTSNATGFQIAGGTTSKTFVVQNSITLAGTDATTITLPSTTGTVALNNQSFFLGTTSVAINRASASLALTGITSIDGSAASATKSTNLVGGNNTTLLGSIPYQSNTDTTSLLSPNVSTTKNFLSQTGTGTNGAAPSWSTVTKSDVGLGSVENTALSTWAGSINITTTGTVTSGTWSGSFGAVSGANLTTLNASNLSSGTVGTARLGTGTANSTTFLRGDGTWATPSAGSSSLSTLTDVTLGTLAHNDFLVYNGSTSKWNNGTPSAIKTILSLNNVENTALSTWTGSANITTTGTVTSGTWSGSFGAVSGANLTSLNASNLSTGTVGTARLGTGTASSTTYLRGDGSWQAVTASATPGGSDTSIQFNQTGGMGGASDLTWDYTNKKFYLNSQWGEMHLGATTGTVNGNPVLAFHSSGRSTYDANIYADGGSATANTGDLYFQCGNEFHYSDVSYLKTTANPAFVRIRTPAGQKRYLDFTSGTSARINVGTDSIAEVGSNVGSNFYIETFTDAGASLETPLKVMRQTGQTILKHAALTNLETFQNPGTDNLTVQTAKVGQLPKLYTYTSSGIKSAMQDDIADGNIAFWQPPGNSTTVPGILGMNAPTALGTATNRAVATTNLSTRLKRLYYLSAATAGSFAGHYSTAAQYTVGGATGSGFFYSCVFSMTSAAALATKRAFIGVSSSTAAPTNVDPNTLTNSIGVGVVSGSSNLQICYGGSAAQTKIDLGANFPGDSLSADAYRLTLFADPTLSNAVGYTVERLGTAFTATGTLTGTAGTALPANTTLLGHRAWVCNNAAAQAIGIDIGTVYFELFL
jgi:hypothetical protein